GVAFDPAGTRFACTTHSGSVIYEELTGRKVLALADPNNTEPTVTMCVTFSPDGSIIATGGGSTALGVVKLWDAGTGRKLHEFAGNTTAVITVAFSPDGQRLGSASHDHTAKIWNTEAGVLVVTLRGHDDRVSGM